VQITKDQEIIEKFLRDLVKQVSQKYEDQLDFIILFGSAARGEFRIGVSDIDLVIQLKEGKKQEEIEKFATEIFWELNKEYKTRFEEVLATVKSHNLLDNFLKGVEKEAHLYVPIFVFPPGWLDWEKGRITRLRWKLPAVFFIHQSFIFQRFKEEGKILYGRDIRTQINPKISFWERWKAIQIPFWLSFFSLLVLLLMPKRAVKWATKAVLYELDSALDFLGKRPDEKTERISALNKEATSDVDIKLFEVHFRISLSFFSKKDLEIFDEASDIKLGVITLSRVQSDAFVLRAFWFIVRTNWSVVIRRYFTKGNLFKILLVFLILALGTYFGISFYALYKLGHPEPKPLSFNPTDISKNFEDISFKSREDSLNITGWFFEESPNNKTIILVSGSDQNRICRAAFAT